MTRLSFLVCVSWVVDSSGGNVCPRAILLVVVAVPRFFSHPSSLLSPFPAFFPPGFFSSVGLACFHGGMAAHGVRTGAERGRSPPPAGMRGAQRDSFMGKWEGISGIETASGWTWKREECDDGRGGTSVLR